MNIDDRKNEIPTLSVGIISTKGGFKVQSIENRICKTIKVTSTKWIKNVRSGNSGNRIYKVTKCISVAFGHLIGFIPQN